jgi:hypothetical protein
VIKHLRAQAGSLANMEASCDACTFGSTPHKAAQEAPSVVCGVQVGEEASVRKDIVIRPFATCHSIPSQGYLVVSKKSKLKPEFAGACKEVIIDAKKKGTEISCMTEVCSKLPAPSCASCLVWVKQSMCSP